MTNNQFDNSNEKKRPTQPQNIPKRCNIQARSSVQNIKVPEEKKKILLNLLYISAHFILFLKIYSCCPKMSFRILNQFYLVC